MCLQRTEPLNTDPWKSLVSLIAIAGCDVCLGVADLRDATCSARSAVIEAAGIWPVKNCGQSLQNTLVPTAAAVASAQFRRSGTGDALTLQR